jgi:hypothetical protein
MEQRAPRFREAGQRGLLRLLHLQLRRVSPSVRSESELARTIPVAYQPEEVRVEAYEVLFPLYGVPQLAQQERQGGDRIPEF